MYFLLFILFFISYGYFFQGGGWNQNSRICLTRSIIDHGTFTIDAYKEDAPGMEFVNAGDWAYYDGHYYSNKSPGLSFMAAPFFAASQTLLTRLIPGDAGRQVLMSAYLSTVFTVGVLSVFLCLLIFYVFHRIFSMSVKAALLLTVLFGFGTLAFSYSTTFYSHQPAACCSFLSFVLAMTIRYGAAPRKNMMAVLAGFSAASAVVIEPSAMIMLAGVAFCLVSVREGRSYIPLYVLGCVPPLAVLGWYNYVCFGHPLASGYAYSNDMVMWKVEGKLFGIPGLRRFYDLLISPYRGLFFSSPVLIMALPGLFIALRRKQWLSEILFCAMISGVFIMFIACFHAWHGGWAAGPRYLLPAFPWIFMMAGLSLQRFPRVFVGIGLLSLLLNLAITIVGNEIPLEVKHPLTDVILKNLIAGRVSINPFPISQCESYTMAEMARIDVWRANFSSFNLGELLFPYSIASVLPLAVFWVIWWYWWNKSTGGGYIQRGRKRK
jgi:hypothetical protein